MAQPPSICVFGGARSGIDGAYQQGASELGVAIAARRFELVYGGGSIGLMGSVAQSALDNGAAVTGVIPDFLAYSEALHRGLTRTIFVDDLFQRKAKMIELSDAFIALPGGIGTLDELFEVLTWRQLHQLDSAIGVLDSAGYFAPWFDALEHAVGQGFVEDKYISTIIRSTNAKVLLDTMYPA